MLVTTSHNNHHWILFPQVCLPYAAAYILDGSVAHESLLAAVEISLGRYFIQLLSASPLPAINVDGGKSI